MTIEEIKAVKNLKTQQIFVYSLIFASGLSIYINNGQIDLIINKENASVTERELYNIDLLWADQPNLDYKYFI